MLTTAEAREAILLAMPKLGSTPIETAAASGRVLRQAVHAERDQPPFDRVTMDGIAVSYESLTQGVTRFRIVATQHAGDPATALTDSDDMPGCIEVMTGGVLPSGSDCVIPVERIAVSEGWAEVEAGYRAERQQFVHARGSDHRQGSALLQAGSTIGPAEVAIIASCGLASVEVSQQPVIRVISTGNELVPAGAPVAAHQIRSSNGPALIAMLLQQGFSNCRHQHLVDDQESLRTRIGDELREAQIIILSGGVSMGKADFVPQVLVELGVKKVFHKISQRPGKPMWFGLGPDDQAVFALPGNPVSTLVCCRQYVLPALLAASGRAAPANEWAILTEDVTFEPQLTSFLPVRLRSDIDGITRARPVAVNTSGDFTALGGTDGYVELERERNHFAQGSPVPLHRWDRP